MWDQIKNDGREVMCLGVSKDSIWCGHLCDTSRLWFVTCSCEQYL